MKTKSEPEATSEEPSYFRRYSIEGGRFWGRGRLAYNGAQLLITGIMLLRVEGGVHYLGENSARYIADAILSNIFYCSAYIIEAIVQIPALRPFRRQIRWLCLIAGTLFVCTFAWMELDTFILCPPYND